VQREGGLIRLMNDYTVRRPLWGEGGLLAAGDPPLPAPLEEKIARWAEGFNADFDHLRGWPSHERYLAHQALALEIMDELQRIQGPEAVLLDLWETHVHMR